MESPHLMIDELLSGMLDGILSDDEVRQVEGAMLADPSLAKRLDDLSRLRTGLLSGRNRTRLGAEFASKVLKLSRERALGLGSECPAWLRRSQSESVGWNTANSEVVKRPSKISWVYGVVLASAAAFALVYASLPGRNELGNLARLSLQENEAAPEAIEDSNNVSFLLAANQPGIGPRETAVPEVSVATPSLGNSVAQVEPSKPRVPSSDQATSNIATNTKFSIDSTAVADLGPIADPKQDKLKLEMDRSSNQLFTLVIDISVDKVAIENRALESILESHGVVYAEDLSINADQLAALEGSQLTGRAKADGAEKMGVMFVRAPADKLSSAIEEISDRYRDFPEFTMDIAYDSSVGLLIKQLSGIKVAEESNGVLFNLVPPQSSKSSLPFTASSRKPGIFSREMMKKGPSKVLPESQGISYVLLLIRAAK